MVRRGQEELTEAIAEGNKEGMEAAKKKIDKGVQTAEHFGDKPKSEK